jgi:hypothetical protein
VNDFLGQDWESVIKSIESALFEARKLRNHCGVSPSAESLKLRRMRVRNEISLNTEGGADRAEDLEALLEELRRLSKQIEEAEHYGMVWIECRRDQQRGDS